MNVNCRLEMPEGAQKNGLTVGERFGMICDGLSGAALGEKPQIVMASPETKYGLHLLEVQEASGNHLKLVVTSYRPGEYSDQSVTISDGITELKVNPLSWNVASILEPSEQPKPVPSIGPFMAAWPLWFWLVLAGTLLGILGTIGLLGHRRRQRQRLRAELEKYQTMLTPFSQFSRDMRQFQRRLSGLRPDASGQDFSRELNEMFRLYLIRELCVPALQVSTARILSSISTEHRLVHRELKGELQRVLTELTEAQGKPQQVTAKDCEDLAILVRQVADRIHGLVAKTKGKLQVGR